MANFRACEHSLYTVPVFHTQPVCYLFSGIAYVKNGPYSIDKQFLFPAQICFPW